MRPLLLCLLLGWAAALCAEPAPLAVSVRRLEWTGRDMYEIHVSGAVRAAPATVWKVLTGYEEMSQFVPDLNACHVLSRNGNEAIVEQYGTVHFLFIPKTIHLVVRAHETPMSSIDIALVAGDMKLYTSRWELAPQPGGTRIVYRGRLVPDFYVPGLLGARLIRSDVERMLAAVLARIERVQEDGAGMPATAQAR